MNDLNGISALAAIPLADGFERPAKRSAQPGGTDLAGRLQD